jgi:hypothetical protein
MAMHNALIVPYCRELGIPFMASFDTDFDNMPWLTRLAGLVSM